MVLTSLILWLLYYENGGDSGFGSVDSSSDVSTSQNFILLDPPNFFGQSTLYPSSTFLSFFSFSENENKKEKERKNRATIASNGMVRL